MTMGHAQLRWILNPNLFKPPTLRRCGCGRRCSCCWCRRAGRCTRRTRPACRSRRWWRCWTPWSGCRPPRAPPTTTCRCAARLPLPRQTTRCFCVLGSLRVIVVSATGFTLHQHSAIWPQNNLMGRFCPPRLGGARVSSLSSPPVICATPVAAQVPEDRVLADPPLLRLESEASHAYLSILLHVQTAQPELASSEVRSTRRWHVHPVLQAAGVDVHARLAITACIGGFYVKPSQRLCVTTPSSLHVTGGGRSVEAGAAVHRKPDALPAHQARQRA